MGDSLSVTIISSLPEDYVSVKDGERKTDLNKKASVVAAEAIPEPVLDSEPTKEVQQEDDEVEAGKVSATLEEIETEEAKELEIDKVNETNESAETPDIKTIDTDSGIDAEGEKSNQEVEEESADESDDQEELSKAEEAEEAEPVSPPKKVEYSSDNRRELPQGELLLDGGPKGKFEGEAPNLVDGEDLDIPAFLRKKK